MKRVDLTVSLNKSVPEKRGKQGKKQQAVVADKQKKNEYVKVQMYKELKQKYNKVKIKYKALKKKCKENENKKKEIPVQENVERDKGPKEPEVYQPVINYLDLVVKNNWKVGHENIQLKKKNKLLAQGNGPLAQDNATLRKMNAILEARTKESEEQVGRLNSMVSYLQKRVQELEAVKSTTHQEKQKEKSDIPCIKLEPLSVEPYGAYSQSSIYFNVEDAPK
ncbi:MAG TPA: hypothetical protein VEK38_02155 [Candidatus Bathyarchaeia archaeon]|nr:hypothetical protein [Candidatus Bathyarchaeia archaeon]